MCSRSNPNVIVVVFVSECITRVYMGGKKNVRFNKAVYAVLFTCPYGVCVCVSISTGHVRERVQYVLCDLAISVVSQVL